MINELKLIYEERESRSIALLLLESIGYNNISLSMEPSTLIGSDKQSRIKKYLKEILNHRPVQYVLGFTEFCSLSFKVCEKVLIPRPETEELVDLIINSYRDSKINILDICTGSGCIAVSLAKYITGSYVFATDFSLGAIEVARENALNNQVDISFFHDNILSPSVFFKPGFFDLVVSNPPYVLRDETSYMRRNVLDYEPHSALFTDSRDPLLFYKAVLAYSYPLMKPEGDIYLEINERFGGQIKSLMQFNSFGAVEVLEDINGKDRFVWGRKSV